MMDAYSELEGCIENDRKYMLEEILDLLKKQGPWGIGIRPVNRAELRQVTLSKPTSVNSGFAIGLRYVKKKNGRQTEDHFAVEPGVPIERHYRDSLEQKWPEYGGTHWQNVVFTRVANEPAPTTPERGSNSKN